MKRRMDIKVQLTPYELATDFCDMGSDEQALFFQYIMQISDTWEKPFCMQVQYIIDSEQFSNDSKRFMRLLGEYSD